jgi:hypothetical protein
MISPWISRSNIEDFGWDSGLSYDKAAPEDRHLS